MVRTYYFIFPLLQDDSKKLQQIVLPPLVVSIWSDHLISISDITHNILIYYVQYTIVRYVDADQNPDESKLCYSRSPNSQGQNKKSTGK